MNQSALDLPVTTIAEKFIVDNLRAKGIFIYPVSDQFPMKERLRRAIIDNKIDFVILGRNSATKKCETFAQAFERLYNDPLEPKQSKGKKHAESA